MQLDKPVGQAASANDAGIIQLVLAPNGTYVAMAGSATGGLPAASATAALAQSANNVSSLVLRSTSCNVDIIQVNVGTVDGWLMLYEGAAPPSNGAIAPTFVWRAPANTTQDHGFDPPLLMAGGAVLLFSTTGPATLTLSATAQFGGRIT